MPKAISFGVMCLAALLVSTAAADYRALLQTDSEGWLNGRRGFFIAGHTLRRPATSAATAG
jgi:hypothetical protein